MLGIYLALSAAIILVFADALKKQLGTRYSQIVIIWNTAVFGTLINFGASWAIGASISSPASLWWLPVSIALIVLGEITFIRAMVSGEFSEVAPLRAAGPVLSVLFAFLFLSEIPSLRALIGMASVIWGVWALSPRSQGRTGPLLSVGARYMIAAQAIGVLLGISIKLASPGVSPILYFSFALSGAVLVFSLMLLGRRENPLQIYQDSRIRAIILSILWGGGIALLHISPSFTKVAYAQASSQIYLPISLVLSRYIFREHEAFKRIFPAIIILLGVLLIILGVD